MTHVSEIPASILRLDAAQIRAICHGLLRYVPEGVSILADECRPCGEWTIERMAVFQVRDDARIWAFTWQCAVGDESEYPAAYGAFEVEAREVRTIHYVPKR